MVSPFPAADARFENPDTEKQMELIMDIITRIPKYPGGDKPCPVKKVESPRLGTEQSIDGHFGRG